MRSAAAVSGPLSGPSRSARPPTQRRAANVRTNGTSAEITSPRAEISSRSVRRGSSTVWAGR